MELFSVVELNSLSRIYGLGTSQVEVQTQIDFWSDPVERTPVCSQTKITGSFPNFERTTVWSWSGDGLIRGHFGLESLIITSSSALGSDHKEFERNWVWSEAQLSLIINGSSAVGSDQKCFRTQLGLIRDHFKRLIFFFIFLFLFLYWEMLALPRGNNKAALWSETNLKSDSSDQKKRSPADSKCRSPSEEILINWRPRCFLWKAV